jgi:DNA (cytosine-5)-methyltransferase 1
MPQRRRRTYIVGYQKDSVVAKKIERMEDWVEFDGVMAKAFEFRPKEKTVSEFDIVGTIQEVSAGFNKGKKESPFGNAGMMMNRHVYSVDADAVYDGPRQTLGGNLINEELVPEEFFISEEELPKWEYEKGAKKIERVSKEGFKYTFSEGGMAFPDYLDQPSRTIITGEGGTAPSRFKHVVKTESGRYRRLLPIELERMNMFPDNHTLHPEVSDGRRAFLMGNALVCGIVQEIGRSLYQFIYDEAAVSTKPIFTNRDARPMLDLGLFADEEKIIVVNRPKKQYTLDKAKHLLIGVVKKDNEEYFLKEEPTKVYYTGPSGTFPSTIAINKLYYFMPYIKGKGVSDLYLIRVARVGTKAEVHPETEDERPRLVFELEYLESLPQNQWVRLDKDTDFAFKDTLLGRIMKDK